MPTIPSSAALIDRCGSWPSTTVQAGFVTAQQLADQPDRRSQPRERLVESVWRAMCRHGRDVTDVRYDHWRRERLRQIRLDGVTVARVPRAELLKRHLGGPDADWAPVVEAASSDLTDEQRVVVPAQPRAASDSSSTVAMPAPPRKQHERSIPRRLSDGRPLLPAATPTTGTRAYCQASSPARVQLTAPARRVAKNICRNARYRYRSLVQS
jgi:hypothetical protein